MENVEKLGFKKGDSILGTNPTISIVHRYKNQFDNQLGKGIFLRMIFPFVPIRF